MTEINDATIRYEIVYSDQISNFTANPLFLSPSSSQSVTSTSLVQIGSDVQFKWPTATAHLFPARQSAKNAKNVVVW
uniref:Uncharacterized protein n=1 Tax=Romanomermis culicivorax TaxID=13658 RepID=A0A915JE02_ROMCU